MPEVTVLQTEVEHTALEIHRDFFAGVNAYDSYVEGIYWRGGNLCLKIDNIGTAEMGELIEAYSNGDMFNFESLSRLKTATPATSFDMWEISLSINVRVDFR